MPTFVQPSNDTARAAFLNTALGAARSDQTAGNLYVLPDTYEQLQAFAPEFESKVTTINQRLSTRSKELDEGNSALDELTRYVRDGFEVLRRQVVRCNLPAHVLTSHGLPLDGKTPHPSTASEWLTIARTFLDGARKVKAEGFPVISCPAPEEIETVLQKADKEHAEVAAADRAYDEAQQEMADARRQADELIGDIMAELRLTLRKMDSPSQRRVMRSYGARFMYAAGEPVDEGDEHPVVQS